MKARSTKKFGGPKNPKVGYAQLRQLGKFLDSIPDVIAREEILELFIKTGKQGDAKPEDFVRLKELLTENNIPYEEFEKLKKTVCRQ